MLWAPRQQLQDGKYVIERVLGKGGGITYLARDNKGNKVVIKTLNDEAQSEPEFAKLQQDFMNEALRLAKFNHPHIVKVYKVFQEVVSRSVSHQGNNLLRWFLRAAPPQQQSPNTALWCILMEYIEGENLQKYVEKQGALPEAEALRYIQQIGLALTVIHREGVLHRDIKPGNIVLRAGKEEAVLIDFGIARELASDRTQRHTELVTPGYAPIEQYDPEAKRGEYTDVYALAATLYYLLTATEPTAACLRVREAPLKPLKQINPNISDTVLEAINWGMNVLPEDRPQSVQNWLELLDTSLQIPNPASVPKTPFVTITSPPPDDLSSAVGVDYRQLGDLLAAGQWQEADRETAKVMLKVSNRETEGWLRFEDIERFPCADLRTIDQLWVKYSNGRFGFSVQKRIFQEVGGTPGKYDDKIWEKFGERIHWRVSDRWLFYYEYTFSSDASPGYLPYYVYDNIFKEFRRIDWEFVVGLVGRVTSSLAQRLVNCNL